MLPGVLLRLWWRGWRVPPGLVITTAAYARFLEANDLERVIRMELGRKPMEEMRWEEIWDVALRIRNRFLRAPVPDEVRADAATLKAHPTR